MTMRGPIRLTVCLLALAVLALGTTDAWAAKRNKPRAVKAVASATGAGAVASATATCPSDSSKGPWRAVSGGFVLQQGDGVVHESRRVGERSWRA